MQLRDAAYIRPEGVFGHVRCAEAYVCGHGYAPLRERFVLTNQYKISVAIGSFSVPTVLLNFLY
jgi:hypothetical protein